MEYLLRPSTMLEREAERLGNHDLELTRRELYGAPTLEALRQGLRAAAALLREYERVGGHDRLCQRCLLRPISTDAHTDTTPGSAPEEMCEWCASTMAAECENCEQRWLYSLLVTCNRCGDTVCEWCARDRHEHYPVPIVPFTEAGRIL